MARRHRRDPHTRKYHIDGRTYDELAGSRRQVWNGTAYRTPGGLTKHHLHYNSRTRRIVSAKKARTAKKEGRLAKHGWGHEKGRFGAVRIGEGAKRRTGTRKRRSRRRRSYRY